MNSRILSPVSLLRMAPGLLLLLTAGCTTPDATPRPSTSPATAAPAAKAVGAFDDDAHALTPGEQAVIAAGKDQTKLAALEHDLLVKMQDPASPPALVQEAAQQLGFVMQTGATGPAATTLAVLAPMLSDPARLDYARLALDRVPGESVDALYLAALPGSTGRVRLGLIQSAATRGLTAAVPLLASWLNDSDPALATATAQALGRLGGSAALTALESAKAPLAPAGINARLAAAAKTNAATAARVDGEIYRNAAAPLPQRSAALRQLINADPAKAAEEIYAALSSAEPAFQIVAIAAISVPEVLVSSVELADRLGSYNPSLQVAVITALGTRGHAGAVPGLLKTLDSTDAGVRLAAIDALGRLPGSMAVAKRLASLATGKGDEAKAAFASLARLTGPGVETSIRAGAETDSPLQAVFIQELAARNETEAIPFLLDLRNSPAEPLRLEALDALRAIAGSNELPAVIAWAIGTPSKAEQNRAVRALITIILRDGAIETRAAPIIAALKSGDATARQILLPVLSRVAGKAARDSAAGLARDASLPVATAATAELARWPDATALPILVDLAVATPAAEVRTAAANGAARFLAQSTPAIAATRSAQTRALLKLSLDGPTRTTLLNSLSLCGDAAALDTARQFAADPDAGAAARDAIEAITSNLAGRPVVTASAAPEDAALMADGKADTFWQVPNEAGTWILADLHSTRPVRKITLGHGGRGWGFPGKFDVQVSDNPAQPGTVVAQGEGERGQTSITLPAGTRGRYVWLRLTGKRDAPLAIAELMVE